MKTIKLSEKSQTSLGANASHGFFLGGASTSAIFTRPTSLASGELITGSDNPAPDILHTPPPHLQSWSSTPPPHLHAADLATPLRHCDSWASPDMVGANHSKCINCGVFVGRKYLSYFWHLSLLVRIDKSSTDILAEVTKGNNWKSAKKTGEKHLSNPAIHKVSSRNDIKIICL